MTTAGRTDGFSEGEGPGRSEGPRTVDPWIALALVGLVLAYLLVFALLLLKPAPQPTGPSLRDAAPRPLAATKTAGESVAVRSRAASFSSLCPYQALALLGLAGGLFLTLEPGGCGYCGKELPPGEYNCGAPACEPPMPMDPDQAPPQGTSERFRFIEDRINRNPGDDAW